MPANSSTEPALLIVALSARALAESARRSGFAPRVLDGFADLDTRAAADTWRRVPLRAGGLDGKALLAAADVLDPEQRLPVVCGSGFESRTRLLARLCCRRPLLGNTPATIRAVKQPRRLAELLARLGIPHPELEPLSPRGRGVGAARARVRGQWNRVGWATCCPRGFCRLQKSPLTPLFQRGGKGWIAPGDWLIKRAGASGGGHVRTGNADPGRGDYRQRRVPGHSLSLLFLADGRRACPAGWNETWCDTGNPDRPYRYGGALTLDPEQVPESVRTELPAALDRLVDATGLVGLCGVDLIADGPRWWLIEINPRPPATSELHERAPGLLMLHRDAVRGRLPEMPAPPADCRGHAVVYADRAVHVGGIDWPDWVGDRPAPGAEIATGQPLCTLPADGPDPARVRSLLAERRHQLFALLSEGHSS